ncbi:hypothetical protein BDW22DRAFT_1427155 [Trametopsis cervina]|nr:hypothetical protein BDW22DRAFT_1427155 [Trametopsis cervina]
MASYEAGSSRRFIALHSILISILYGRLDSSTSRPRRTFDIKLFQQEKSRLFDVY